MDMIKKYFPLAFKAKDLQAFIIILVTYVLVDLLCGLVIGLLAEIEIIGVLFGIIGWAVGLYALAGIILSILVYVKVIE